MGNFSTSQDSLPFSYTFSFYISHFTLSILHLTAQVENSLRLCASAVNNYEKFLSSNKSKKEVVRYFNAGEELT
ncbi:MAG: hypothetical protein AB1422_00995 [bacterium]